MASIARRICGRASRREREEVPDTFLDISAADALFCAELLDPLSRDGMVGTKALVKGLTAGLRSETSTMTVAAVCLMSTTEKVAHDKVSVEDVKRLFRRSFHELKGADHRVSHATLTSGDTFKGWAAAAGFDATSTAHDVDQRQTVTHTATLRSCPGCACWGGSSPPSASSGARGFRSGSPRHNAQAIASSFRPGMRSHQLRHTGVQ